MDVEVRDFPVVGTTSAIGGVSTDRHNQAAAGSSQLPDPEALSESTYMKRIRQSNSAQEPIGIVISRGTRGEDTPVFWAYVWGPAPEEAYESGDSKAA